jgi:hypothetical protein
MAYYMNILRQDGTALLHNEGCRTAHRARLPDRPWFKPE